MLALWSRVFSSIMVGLCLSTFVVLLMTLFLTVRNFPSILESFQRFIKAIFRGSFRLYSAILNPIRVEVFHQTGFDLFHPVSRVLCTLILSILIGTGLMALFAQPILERELIILTVHGLFVGLAWDGILRSNDFQLGVNLE